MASAGAMHAARLLLRAAYDPDQPRDEQGQWTDGGNQFVSTDQAPENAPVRATQSKLSQAEDFAVGWFTDEGYMDVNSSLRSGSLPSGPEGEPWEGLVDLDSAILRGTMTHDAVLYRGVQGNHGLQNLMAGDEFVDRGFISTTSNKQTAREFAGSKGGAENSRVVQIQVPKGVHALSTSSLNELSEEEYILGRGTRFKVIHNSSKALVLRVRQ